MGISDASRFIRLLAMCGVLLSSCTAELDALRLEASDDDRQDAQTPVATGHNDLGGTGSPVTEVPNQSNVDGTKGAITSEPDAGAPTCAEGLLNNAGFCVPEVHCAPGTFITEMNGNPACAPCASGSFSLAYDATECVKWKDCVPGEFVARVGTSSTDRTCEVCAQGESSTVMNAGECSGESDCPPGSFKFDAECEPCHPGSYCSGKTDSEQTCEAGTWDDDMDPGTPCVVTTTCAAGQFVQEPATPTKDQTCEFCPSETFSTQMNSIACEAWSACEAGTHVALQGSSSTDRVCKVCEPGTFTATSNGATCSTWSTCTAPNEYAQNEPDGTTDRSCVMCASGQVAETDNATQCVDSGPVNLVANAGFELSTDGWITWNGGVLSRSGSKARSGAYSLLLTGPGTGPAAIELHTVAKAGATYDASFWVSVGKVSNAQVNLTRTLVCGGNTTYVWLAEHSAAPSTDWTNLKGSFSIPSDCVSPQLTVYVEGSGQNVDLYVDDVSVVERE